MCCRYTTEWYSATKRRQSFALWMELEIVMLRGSRQAMKENKLGSFLSGI